MSTCPTCGQPAEKPLLGVREAAKLLGISDRAMRQAVQSGQMPSIQLSRTIRIPRSALPLWIERATEDTAAQLGVPARLSERRRNAIGGTTKRSRPNAKNRAL